MKEELKAFHIDIDEIKPNNDLFLNINEALNKMAQNYVAERFEVVLNNNLLEAKDKYSNFRTILGCRISYDNLDKNISFIVREDKKPSYEELQQELQRKDNIINELKKWLSHSIEKINQKLINDKEITVKDGMIMNMNDYQILRLKSFRRKMEDVLVKIKELEKI